MSVIFERKDVYDELIVSLTITVAQHFSVNRKSKKFFVKLIRGKWFISDEFKKSVKDKFSALEFEDEEEVNLIFEQAFSCCVDQKSVDKVRGALAEGLLLGLYGESIINSKSFGWGANVKLLSSNKKNAYRVKYSCPRHCDLESAECYSRETVDLGIWDGEYGRFFECKTRPGSVGRPEINYMKELFTALKKKNIKGKVFFATTDSVENAKMRINKKYPEENFFEIISLEDSIA
ncbi:hypothetical protein [Bacillus pumilus]|uniref:hypothetical protein n=1 Tax=Bacillus pumilus TaxID=1408 RepID=UPI003D05B7D5